MYGALFAAVGSAIDAGGDTTIHITCYNPLILSICPHTTHHG